MRRAQELRPCWEGRRPWQAQHTPSSPVSPGASPASPLAHRSANEPHGRPSQIRIKTQPFAVPHRPGQTVPPRTQRENLLTRLRTWQHKVGALEEVAERRAGVWRGGTPNGAQRAVGDGEVRGEVGGEVPEIGVQVDGGGGGREEGADGIGCCYGETRRRGGRRHGSLRGRMMLRPCLEQLSPPTLQFQAKISW